MGFGDVSPSAEGATGEKGAAEDVEGQDKEGKLKGCLCLVLPPMEACGWAASGYTIHKVVCGPTHLTKCMVFSIRRGLKQGNDLLICPSQTAGFGLHICLECSSSLRSL